jgi:glycosyltransferase involved in cell wall biosynthesis
VIHVGLNLVYLVPGETGGMETYARELVPRLAALDGLRLTAFVNREAAEAADGPWGDVVPMQVVPVRARNRLEWVRGEQLHVPRLAAQAGCDLLHSLASTAPLRGRTPGVTTVHDLNYRKVPDAHFGIRGLGMRVLVPAAARRSRRIVAVSRSTRDDIVADLGVPASKIDVVPHGVAAPPSPPPEAAATARARFGLGDRPVVLSV